MVTFVNPEIDPEGPELMTVSEFIKAAGVGA